MNGYKFAVHYEDLTCGPLPATQAAKRLLEQFKPDIIIGEECSDATLAMMPIVDQAKVPLMNAGSSSIKITEPGNRWTFRIMPNEVMQGVDIATNAYNRLNARTAVLLYENTNAGIGNAKVSTTPSPSSAAKSWPTSASAATSTISPPSRRASPGLGKIDVFPTYTLEGQGLKITQALAHPGHGKNVRIVPGWPTIAVIEVISPGVIEVDCLLHEPQAHELRVEVDVRLRVGSDSRDVMNS